PADYKKAAKGVEQGVNDPMQPIAWTREYKNEAGKTNKVLTTTTGAATDLVNEGLRRLIVNAAYAFTGLDVPAKADVTIDGEYKPTFYGFIKDFKTTLKPADLELNK
ncbi:MAG: signal peptide and transrane prediction, partial [Verrucomicrobiaceae bacterium]|nr:signal peptide and transrane prediction [Verrucomicrobiaceae bacterium]